MTGGGRIRERRKLEETRRLADQEKRKKGEMKQDGVDHPLFCNDFFFKVDCLKNPPNINPFS